MKWKRLDREMPPERPWAHVLLCEEGSEQAALIWCDGEGYGWLGFREGGAMTLSEIRAVADMVGGSKGFTHWLLVEAPAPIDPERVEREREREQARALRKAQKEDDAREMRKKLDARLGVKFRVLERHDAGETLRAIAKDTGFSPSYVGIMVRKARRLHELGVYRRWSERQATQA